MTSRARFLLFTLVVLNAALLWWTARPTNGPEEIPVSGRVTTNTAPDSPVPSPGTPSRTKAGASPQVPRQEPTAGTTDVAPAVPPPALRPQVSPARAAEMPDEAGPASRLAPATALENMRTAFHQYQSRFGGNPVGNNAEITAALTGQNPEKAVLVTAEDGASVNARGELVDSWGTPYFFHQLSAQVMEVRSAGPDRKMWTRDDIVTK